ncbi:hypothetical protein COD86_22260 [Bacillus cereus]|nr:hypothetical protein COD14_23170 [Bacillus cereus]PGV91798.1 hypothetical protein COD86_22260 [Bacillus cereus]
MRSILNYIRIFWLIYLVDLKRLFNRLISVVASNLIKEKSKKYIFIVITVAVTLMFISVIAFICLLFELLSKNVLNESIVQPTISSIIVFHFISGCIGTIQSYERAIQPEDFEIIVRSPTPKFLFIINRFISTKIFNMIILIIFIVEPVCIASTWIFEKNMFLLLFGPIVTCLYYIFHLGFTGVVGFYGYKLILQWNLTTIRIVSNVIFIIVMGCTVVLSIFWWFFNKKFTMEVLFDFVTGLTKNIMIPTNWYVYCLESLIKGNQITFLTWFAILIIPSILVFSYFLRLTKYADIKPMFSLVMNGTVKNNSWIYKLYKNLFTNMAFNHNYILNKDIKSLMRVSEMVRYRLLKMFYVIAFIIGGVIGVGVIWEKFNIGYWGVIFISIILSKLFCSFLGEGLLPITSIDSEKNNINLFLHRGVQPQKLFWSKLVLHVCCLLVFNIGFIIIALPFFTFSVSIIITCICLISIFSITYGCIQVGVTAIYPKFDWEHYFEIGRSRRAVWLGNILSTIYLMLILQGAGGFLALYHFNCISFLIMQCLLIIWYLVIGGIMVSICLSLINRKGTKHWEGIR